MNFLITSIPAQYTRPSASIPRPLCHVKKTFFENFFAEGNGHKERGGKGSIHL